MKNTSRGLVGLFAGVLTGLSACGGGGGTSGSGGLSCDIDPASGGKGSEHICIASTGYGKVAGDSSATQANCGVAGGKLGSSCNLTGAVAGCQGTGAGGGDYITFTYWYYSGTVQDVAAKCPSPMTVVMPGQQQAGAGGGSGNPGGGGSGVGGGAGAPPTYLTGVTAVSSGFSHSCAIIAAGKVACWGVNSSFALGNSGVPDSPAPRVVPGISGAVSISTGNNFACVVLQDGTARCWGDSIGGKLGAGDLPPGPTGYPVPVFGLTNVSQVSAGDDFACAITGGEVWCWGSNIWDELGAASTALPSSSKPVKITGLSNVTGISSWGRHTCALMDGAVWCWGENSSSEAGIARTTSADRIATPVQVAGLSGVVSVTTSNNASYAVLADGTAWCWGYDGCEQHGARSLVNSSAVPVKVPVFSNLTSLTVGVRPFCGLQKGGIVQCPAIPTAVAGLSGVKTVTGAGDFTCLLVGDGVQCWGVNNLGQIGSGAEAEMVGTGTLLTVIPSRVVAPCCGADNNPSFSTGLPATTRVADLTSAQFQTLCQKTRGDTDGLPESCQAFGVGTAAGAPRTTSDADLKRLCQQTYDSCYPVPATGPYSPSTCPSVAPTPSCTLAIDEVEACMNEQTWMAKRHAASLPSCSAITRAALDALPADVFNATPSCTIVFQSCGQIFQSP